MFRKPKNKKSRSTFRSKTKGKNFRKRSLSEDDDENGDSHAPQYEEDQSTSDLLRKIQSENQQKGWKRVKLSPTSSSQKSRKDVMDSLAVSSSDQTRQLSAKDFATRTAEFHPKEKERKVNDTSAATNSDGAKLYKGEARTRNKFLAGPLKAPTFVRTTSRFDYEPNICKDYKDTGFCGFGDSCIYLHDRGDRKSGWQLEQEWEEKRKRRQQEKEKELARFLKSASDGAMCLPADSTLNEDNMQSNDGLPFACHICREAFKQPVVTRCGHYFCEECILNHVRKEKKTNRITAPCPICNKDTSAVFNFPTKLENKKRRLVGKNASWKDFQDAMRKNQ